MKALALILPQTLFALQVSERQQELRQKQRQLMESQGQCEEDEQDLKNKITMLEPGLNNLDCKSCTISLLCRS